MGKSAALTARILAIADRWRYSPDELAETLTLAERDPTAWRTLVKHDERLHGVALPEPQPTHGRCADCAHYQRTTHPHLGQCAAGEPEPAGGLWDSTWRRCGQFQTVGDCAGQQRHERPNP